jgi:hypothetical protein
MYCHWRLVLRRKSISSHFSKRCNGRLDCKFEGLPRNT